MVVLERSRTPFSITRNSVLLAIGDGAVFALETGSGEVSRIDGGAPRALADGIDAGSIAAGHRAIWLGGRSGVTKIDPSTRSKLGFLPVGGLLDASMTSIQVGTDAVWFAGSALPMLFQIHPRARPLTRTTFNVGRGPSAITVGEGAGTRRI